MKSSVVNGNRIVMFDSIDNLPAGRFEDFNRFYMIDAGIGSDAESVDSHITRLRIFNADGKKEDVDKALINMRQNLVFIINGVSPEMNCFYALLAEINGRKVKATSLEDIELLKAEIERTGITIGKIRGLIAEVKKKLILRLNYFTQRKQIAHS